MSEPIERSAAPNPTPTPTPPPAGVTRRPFNLEIGKALIEASLGMLHQVAGGRQKDPSYVALLSAARDQHLEIALAEFEARLPAITSRNGGEAISKTPADAASS